MKFSGPRKLLLTNSGRWFVGMTIVLGLAAIMARNNVFYLLESFLLGAMILSGILSEITIATATVRWKRRPALAGEKPFDVLEVTNHSRIPFFCLEVGEWKNNRFISRAFIPIIPAKDKVQVEIDSFYKERGSYQWQGLAFSTRFPFGFAQKMRWTYEKGERMIWPSRQNLKKPQRKEKWDSRETTKDRSKFVREGSAVGKQGYGQFSDGEVREYSHGDDLRDIVWTLSATRGEPMVRVRRNPLGTEEVVLDIRTTPGEAFEAQVSAAAQKFYLSLSHVTAAQEKDQSRLIIRSSKESRIVEGSRNCLNELALVQAEGKRKKAA